MAAVAVQHHERLDGSGYPRGLSGGAISPEGRVLAAAASTSHGPSQRPDRVAGTAGEAAAQLRAEVLGPGADGWRGGGRRAVRRRAPGRPRQARQAGLTGREVEVLRLLARGLSNKEIGEHLVISRKTAAHHVRHLYAKTGTTNRALASLFAADHGLMDDPRPQALTCRVATRDAARQQAAGRSSWIAW